MTVSKGFPAGGGGGRIYGLLGGLAPAGPLPGGHRGPVLDDLRGTGAAGVAGVWLADSLIVLMRAYLYLN